MRQNFLVDRTCKNLASLVSWTGSAELIYIREALFDTNVTTALQPVATCRQSPYLRPVYRQRINQLLSLWRPSPCDVIGDWAGHAQRYGRTDALPRLIYEDAAEALAVTSFIVHFPMLSDVLLRL